MSTVNCEACNELREYAPDFVQNGVTDTVAASLKNNTGLNPSLTSLHKNCEDLNDANDCYIGRMVNELPAYDVCDWKQFMSKLLPNLYEILKALIASMCGLWTQMDRIWCWLHNMTDTPQSYSISAYQDDDPTKPAINGFRIADGVIMRSGGDMDTPIRVSCIGNVAYVVGSLSFNGNMPTDYTNGETLPWSYLQQGSAAIQNKAGQYWGADGVSSTEPLIWEIQFKKCQLGFKEFFGAARLHPYSDGDFQMNIYLFGKGQTVPPDYSRKMINGSYPDGSYRFNPVDDDMMLMQVRLQNTRVGLSNVTPRGNINVIACPANWKC